MRFQNNFQKTVRTVWIPSEWLDKMTILSFSSCGLITEKRQKKGQKQLFFSNAQMRSLQRFEDSACVLYANLKLKRGFTFVGQRPLCYFCGLVLTLHGALEFVYSPSLRALGLASAIENALLTIGLLYLDVLFKRRLAKDRHRVAWLFLCVQTIVGFLGAILSHPKTMQWYELLLLSLHWSFVGIPILVWLSYFFLLFQCRSRAESDSEARHCLRLADERRRNVQLLEHGMTHMDVLRHYQRHYSQLRDSFENRAAGSQEVISGNLSELIQLLKETISWQSKSPKRGIRRWTRHILFEMLLDIPVGVKGMILDYLWLQITHVHVQPLSLALDSDPLASALDVDPDLDLDVDLLLVPEGIQRILVQTRKGTHEMILTLDEKLMSLTDAERKEHENYGEVITLLQETSRTKESSDSVFIQKPTQLSLLSLGLLRYMDEHLSLQNKDGCVPCKQLFK
jgi:hypothetical protein